VDGPNVYTYVTQNPWTMFDPLGLEKYPASRGGWLREKIYDRVYNAGAYVLKGVGNTALGYVENQIMTQGAPEGTIGYQAAKGVSDSVKKRGVVGTAMVPVNDVKSAIQGHDQETGREFSQAEKDAKRGSLFVGGSLFKRGSSVFVDSARKQSEETQTLFRGVSADHPDKKAALQGEANPMGGHSDPILHNRGDNESIFTSWSTDREVAQRFAKQDGPGGLILQKEAKKSETVKSPDEVAESEVLLKGKVKNAKVEKADDD